MEETSKYEVPNIEYYEVQKEFEDVFKEIQVFHQKEILISPSIQCLEYSKYPRPLTG